MSLPKTGIKVRLLPYHPERDAEIVMGWFYDVRYQAFFREFDDSPMTLEYFKKLGAAMRMKGLVLYTILDKESSAPLGLMTYECIKKKARVYRWGIMLDCDHQGRTVAIEAIILMSFFLFEHFNASKMAVEFLEADKHIQRITEQGGFTREGVLLNEAVIGGKPVNEVRYSISRETAYELYGSYYASLEEAEGVSLGSINSQPVHSLR